MLKKMYSFKEGDWVLLKDGTDNRQFEIHQLFYDKGFPPQANLVVPGTQQVCHTRSLAVLEKVPVRKTRAVRSASQLPRIASGEQAVVSQLPDDPAVEMVASEQASNQETYLPSTTSDKEHLVADTGDGFDTGTGDRTLPYGPSFLPVHVLSPDNSSPVPVELTESLTRLLSHIQTKSVKRVQPQYHLNDSLANAQNLIDAVHQTFDDIWDDIERRLRKEAQEARIQRDRSQKYEIKIEHLSGVNLSLEVQVRSLLDHVNHIESDQANREQALHQLERQVQLERQEQTHIHSESIRAFWKAREDFYRGVHRGILAEQGSNRKRLKNFRYQSLCADMELIAQLGGTLELFEEAVRFDRCPYDGFLYRWYDEDEEPVPNGTLATVFLPGWQVGDTQVKASLGRKEVDIE